MAQLFQVFPGPAVAATAVSVVRILKPLLTYLLVYGTDSLGRNRLMLYDTTSDTETDLLPGYDIEMYHLSFTTSDNSVRFDGLNFANNQLVLGTIDMTSMAVNLVSIGAGATAKLDDFETW
jgi:hypothetical protein